MRQVAEVESTCRVEFKLLPAVTTFLLVYASILYPSYFVGKYTVFPSPLESKHTPVK